MSKIFISYRRSDSHDITGRIYDRLVREFGQGQVMRDIDVIPLGSDLRDLIQRELHDCQVLLAVIGPSWETLPSENGKPRIRSASDYVRVEIETALARGISVIPVLPGRDDTPNPKRLPETIRELPFRQAASRASLRFGRICAKRAAEGNIGLIMLTLVLRGRYHCRLKALCHFLLKDVGSMK